MIFSTFPRDIVAVGGPEPVVVWVSGASDDGDGSPEVSRERLMLWSPGLEAPRELCSAEALGRPAVCRIDGAVIVACFVLDKGWRIALFRSDGDPAPRPIFTADGEGRWPGEVAICPEGEALLICSERWTEDGPRLIFERRSADLRHRLEAGPPLMGLSPRLVWDGERAWLGWLAGRSRNAPWQIKLVQVDRLGTAVPLTEPGPFRVGGLSLSASAPRRIWAAWHSDRRPGLEADLTRWVETRLVLEGRVFQPGGPPPWARWGQLGEDQGLEHPLIQASPSGAVTLLAKSSHRWWRFDLTRHGWGAPVALDDEGWGCRSRRVGLARLEGDRLLWARRGSAGVVVEELSPAIEKGSPSLVVPVSTVHRPSLRSGRRSSRPVLGGFQVCFGDIHQHTAHSDGTGTAREAYERARDLYGDDLVSVTDHESFLGKRIGAGEWRRLMATCDLFDEPGRFATLPGYEWTGRRHPGPGHRCVYLPDSSMELLGREHELARTSAELIAAVGRAGGLVFPHHVGWTGADAAVHDPRVQTCWEIVSCHGAYEALGQGPIGQRDVPLEGQFIRDQLDAGLRFGLVGGSDGHGLLWHHGVSRRRDSHRTGLTAVLVEELNRRALFEALRARRCYATSGVPILLGFWVDGRPMGSELIAGGVVEVTALAEGLSDLAHADLIGPRGLIIPLETKGSGVRARLDLDPRATGASYLYLRVEQGDGEVAWSSPIWLT